MISVCKDLRSSMLAWVDWISRKEREKFMLEKKWSESLILVTNFISLIGDPLSIVVLPELVPLLIEDLLVSNFEDLCNFRRWGPSDCASCVDVFVVIVGSSSETLLSTTCLILILSVSTVISSSVIP